MKALDRKHLEERVLQMKPTDFVGFCKIYSALVRYAEDYELGKEKYDREKELPIVKKLCGVLSNRIYLDCYQEMQGKNAYWVALDMLSVKETVEKRASGE